MQNQIQEKGIREEKLVEHWGVMTNSKLIEVKGCGVWMGKKCRDKDQHDLVAVSLGCFDYGSKRLVE